MIGKALGAPIIQDEIKAGKHVQHRVRGSTIDLSLYPSLDGVPPAAWDALVADGDLYASHAWLRHLEYAAGPCPVLTCRLRGELLGALPLWNAGADTSGLFHLPDLFPGLDGPWSSRFRWLGPRRSVHNTVVCTSGPYRTNVLARMLEAAVEDASVAGLAGVIMPYMPVAAAVEFAAGHPDARVLLHSAEAVVDVPAGGSDEIMRQASGHNRKRRRRELLDFARSGYTLEWTDVTGQIANEAAVLIANNRSRYGSGQGVDWMHRVLAAQWRTGLLDQAVALLCRRSGRLTAVALCYRHGDQLHGRYYGTDGAAERQGNAYFVTTCHAPLDYAASQGLRRANLSVSSLEAKVRRGAVLEPLAAVVVADGRVQPDHDRVRAHNQRVAHAYRERFASYPASLSPSWSDLPA